MMMQKWATRLKHHHRGLFGSKCLSSYSSSDIFGPPPVLSQRRVVVTGLGMVSPLGSGVETCWQRLIEGKCGIRALSADDLKMDGFENETLLHTLEQLPSRVVAALPHGTGSGEFDAEYWLNSKELEHAKQRRANIYGEVRGYGMSGDAHHITQPESDGHGALLAMYRALQQAGLRPNQVDYINAHATSTPLGDCVEAKAIKTLFDEHALSGDLALSSTKGATGHLLGAAGAVEAIFSVLALYHGIAPPTLNLEEPDPVFHDGFTPLTASKKMSIHSVLSNSFGFGGTNASLMFTSPP